MTLTPPPPVKPPISGTYSLDPDHSSVGFAVLHKVSKFRAGFSEFDATLEVAGDGTISLTGSADVRSLLVKNQEQAAHLQSPEFFDSDRHPVIQFRSTAVTLDADNALSVTGELTLRGHTETVEATGTLTFVDDDLHDQARVGVDLTAVVDRTVFGLNWNQPLPGGGFAVANEVTLVAELEFPKTA